MAVKYKYQVQQIPPGANAQQIEDFLNNAGQNGWLVVQVISVGTSMFVMAVKALSE